MKKFTAKRVFAIIGIVFGLVTAFAGGVIGVMALMGEFRTPVVFPTKLEFMNNGEIVVEKVPYDTNKSWEEQFVGVDDNLKPTIEVLMLKGENSSAEVAVNHKDCLISFVSNTGNDLITLCDEEGKALIANSNSRYLVQCNEPIYYMINKVPENYQRNGIVKLEAKSANDKTKTNEPLTLYIDRAIKGVYIDTTLDGNKIAGTNEQTISTGVGLGFDFKYEVKTPLSLKPIFNNGEKEIELYYIATGYSTDYVKVTKEEIDNPLSPLNTLMSYDENMFRFSASVAGEYEFIIAAFPTYQSKLDYLASIEGMTFDNPNYHKTLSMVTTSLSITVDPIDISEVELIGGIVQLSLYSQNDYLTLDGTSGVDGAKDNNLGLVMKKGTGFNAINDYSRFEEATFEGFKWVDPSVQKAKFVANAATGDELVWEYSNSVNNLIIEKSNVSVGENLYIIEYFKLDNDLDENKYYCINGVAVLNDNGTPANKADDTIELMESGTYLNFYKENGKGEISLFDGFEYEANRVPGKTGQSKTWQIITKTLPNTLAADETLKIGVLVVNKHGRFTIGKFFDSLPVTVSEIELRYDVLQPEFDLDVTFTEIKIVPAKLTFEDILKINSGSHTAIVLLTEQNADDQYRINTINDVVFTIGGRSYVLVGNISDEGKFINEVETNTSLIFAKTDASQAMYVLQLRNSYGDTTEDIINKILLDTSIADSYVHTLYGDSEITANVSWLLNKELLSYNYYDSYDEESKTGIETKVVNGYTAVYENTTSHKIVIRSMNGHMISCLDSYIRNIDVDNFKIDRYSENLTITAAKLSLDKTELILTYEVGPCLSDENIPIEIVFNCENEEYSLGGVVILNGSPETIVFNTGTMDVGTISNAKIALVGNKDNVETYLKIVVGYEAGKYTYTMKYDEKTLDATLIDLFNVNTTDSSDEGFQDPVDGKGQTIEVVYASTDKQIFNTDKLFNVDGSPLMENLVERSGQTVLSVTIGRTTNYIGIETDTSAFELVTEKTIYETTKETFSLNDDNVIDGSKRLIALKNGGTFVSMSAANVVFVDNVRCIRYADGTLVVSGNKNDGWELKKNPEDTTSVLKITAEADGWKFDKKNPHLTLTIEFEVVTIAGSKAINLTFKSNVSLSVNTAWANSRTLYAGTTVTLFSTDSDYSVFKGSNGLTIKVDDEAVDYVWDIDERFICNGTSTNKIEFYLNSTLIHTFTDFAVKSNVVANVLQVEKTVDGETVSVDKTFTSETSYDVNEVYSLFYYDDVTYGSSAETLYNSLNASGEYVNLKQLTNYANLSITPVASGNTNPQVSWSSNKMAVGHMTDLNNSAIRTIILMYKTHSVTANDIEIFNAKSADLKVDKIEALRELTVDDFVVVADYALKSVQADGLTFVIDNGKIKLDTTIKENLEDVELTLTFENISEEKLIYKVVVDICHYAPTAKPTADVAYSGSTYDLLNGLYESSTLNGDANVKQLIVSGIKDDKGNNITTEVVQGIFNPSGYIYGETNANCEIVLKEIAGPTKTIWIEYTITDANDQTYTYLKELTIQNRQTITKQYPEGLEIESSTYQFLQGYEKDGEALSGTDESINGVFALASTAENPIKYEPVAIYSDSSVIIDFNYDSVKKIQRIKVENEDVSITAENTSTNFEIKLIAYENYPGMLNYVTKINTQYDTNKISLPFATPGMAGMLVFKVQTASGNFEYYFIYVCCVGSTENNVSAQNNLKVVAYNSSITYPDSYTEKEIVAVDIKNDARYISLVNSLNASVDLFSSVDGVQEFKTFFGISKKFSFNWNSTSLFLYHGEYAGETESAPFSYSDKRWKEIDVDTETLIVDTHFNIITIGLVYKNDRQCYMYGIITIYVQPNQAIEETDLTYNLPNGEFAKVVNASETEVVCPFDGTWDATVVSVNGEAYPKYYLTSDETAQTGKVYYQKIGETYSEVTVTAGDDIKSSGYYEKEENFTTSTGGKLNLNKRVEHDTTIRVKYVQISGTIAFVTHTYKATILPTVVGIETIGSFKSETDGFITSIDLESDEIYKQVNQNNLKYKQYFFGTYSSDSAYSINIDGEAITDGNKVGIVTLNGSTLKFDQSHEQKVVKVEIVYTNFAGENNSKEFTFVVKSGVHIVETQDAQSGLTSSNRALTDAIGENYNSVNGSKIDVTYAADGNSKFHKYSVKGLTIYTNALSKLVLTFDVNNYIMNSNGTAVLTADGEIGVNKDTGDAGVTIVNFVHSAQEVAVNMGISIQTNGGDVYATRDLYLNVIQTYSMLRAKYVVAGADHENVVKGSTISDLHSTLVSTSRFELLGPTYNEALKDFEVVTSSVNLATMGFAGTDKQNPNYIEFTVAGDASYTSSDSLIFGTVTKNTLCYLYLNNQAGMEQNSVNYVYQIMAGTTADGLDFSTTNGIYDSTDKYVTFLTNDFESTDEEYVSENFVIGTMLDTRNLTIFDVTLNSVYNLINRSEINVETEESDQVGGYFNAIQYSYKINTEAHRIYITLDKDTSNVELVVVRPANQAQLDSIKFTLTITGVNANESKVVDGLTVVVGNYDVKAKYTSNSDQSVLSGYTVDLIKDGKVVGENADEMTYVLESGTYSVNGRTKTITSSDTNNDLFKYSGSTLETKAVGQDVNAQVWFMAKKDVGGTEYKFKAVQYSFTVQLNMQFVVNGASLQANINNTSPETNFVLTETMDKDGTANFPMTIPIISRETFELDDGKEDEIYKTSENYYNVLVFDLYNRYRQNDADATDDELVMPRRNSYTVEMFSASSVCTLVKDATTGEYSLIFNQDYFGDVELKLSVKTDNGTYEVVWTIHVSAIKKITYTNANSDLARMRKGSLPFPSGDLVKMINGTTAEYAALIVKHPDKFANADQEMEIKYQYKIHELNIYTENMTNEKLFTETHSASYIGGSEIISPSNIKTQLQISLPNVPVSDDDAQQSYLVTYEVKFTYLGKSYTYYVTYVVYNSKKVETYTINPGSGATPYSSADIDLKARLVNDDGADPTSETAYLPMFYYNEAYNVSGTIYSFHYINNSYESGGSARFRMKTGGVEYWSTSTGTMLEFIKDGDAVVSYALDLNANPKKFYSVSGGTKTEIKNGSWSKNTTEPWDRKHTVFASSFDNIIQFKEFIDTYIYVSGVADGTYVNIDGQYAELIHVAAGVYGVNLTDWADDAAHGKVQNELNTELKLQDKGIPTIVIPRYSEANTNGFRLYAPGKLEAKTTKLSKMFIPSYFAPNTDIANNPVTISTPIVGVGTPHPTWVTDAKSVDTTSDTNTYATIKIPSNSIDVEYKIKKATFSTTGGSDIYELKASFFYIEEDSVIVPDYSAIGIETTYFKIVYTQSETQEFVLENGFKEWKMDSNKLVSALPGSVSSAGDKIDWVNASEGTGLTKPTYDASKISISSELLRSYKLAHPNKSNYPLVQAIITAGGKTFKCNIEFALPELGEFKVDYAGGTEDVTVNLINSIYIPNSSAGYEKLTSANLDDVDYVFETSAGRFVKEYKDGKLTIDKDKIIAHFTQISPEKYFYIDLELATEKGEVLEFRVLIVDKTVAAT